jgi:N-acetylglucosaminyldiphosphoundecaprenol N-acetyl-beta-D-mannosaminyltransferase
VLVRGPRPRPVAARRHRPGPHPASCLHRTQRRDVPPVTLMPILNGRFAPLTRAAVVEWAARFIRSGRRGYLCTVNVAILMMMRRDPGLQRIVDHAAMVIADGQPIVWLSRRLRRPLPERVAGVDLVDALAARAAREGFSLYLLGSRSDVVEAAAGRLRRQHPGLQVAGIADGYFPASEARARARAVRESGADILLVGMGVPRQEYFVDTWWDELGARLAIGVGGTLDILAGRRRRAPGWCQQAGLEWLCRLAQEPRRLAGRYLVTNTQFLWLAATQLYRARFGGLRFSGVDPS